MKNFQYLTSKKNLLVKHVYNLNFSKSYRKKSCDFVCEGFRLCMEALNSNFLIKYILITEDFINKHGHSFDLHYFKEKLYIVSDSILEYICETNTPQGVVCVCAKLDKTFDFDTIKPNGKYIALENVQDPLNMGTLMRTAEALGIDALILDKQCCEIYSPKVIRGSMGAIFRLPILILPNFNHLFDFVKENNIKTFATVPKLEAKSVLNIDFFGSLICFLGNEANGLTKETINSCEEQITIPMRGRAESLNLSAAGSILMWQMINSF